jgi:hypothetical protein
VQFGTRLLLGQESNKGRVLGLLYGLSRPAIVFNNVLYMYKVLKNIYILSVSPEILGGQLYPHTSTVDPPLLAGLHAETEGHRSTRTMLAAKRIAVGNATWPQRR